MSSINHTPTPEKRPPAGAHLIQRHIVICLHSVSINPCISCQETKGLDFFCLHERSHEKCVRACVSAFQLADSRPSPNFVSVLDRRSGGYIATKQTTQLGASRYDRRPRLFQALCLPLSPVSRDISNTVGDLETSKLDTISSNKECDHDHMCPRRCGR